MSGGFGEGFVSILHHENDRGVKAIMDVLKEMGVMYYDHQNMSIRFREVEVSSIALEHELDKKLGRR